MLGQATARVMRTPCSLRPAKDVASPSTPDKHHSQNILHLSPHSSASLPLSTLASAQSEPAQRKRRNLQLTGLLGANEGTKGQSLLSIKGLISLSTGGRGLSDDGSGGGGLGGGDGSGGFGGHFERGERLEGGWGWRGESGESGGMGGSWARGVSRLS